MTRQPAGPPTATDLSIKESEKKLLEQAQELLNIVVQLGNRNDIEQLNENIKVTCRLFQSFCIDFDRFQLDISFS